MDDKFLQNLKVLIVDDQAEARALFKMMLTEMGITQIFEAPDGKTALSFVDDVPDFVDLVICDWNMPQMTGIQLLRQVRTVYPDMPFLMVTGRADVTSVSEAKASGVTAYIKKPFSAAQLEAKLRVIHHKNLKLAEARA